MYKAHTPVHTVSTTGAFMPDLYLTMGEATEGCTQQTRYIDPMLGSCWPAVSDVGPT